MVPADRRGLRCCLLGFSGRIDGDLSAVLGDSWRVGCLLAPRGVLMRDRVFTGVREDQSRYHGLAWKLALALKFVRVGRGGTEPMAQMVRVCAE